MTSARDVEQDQTFVAIRRELERAVAAVCPYLGQGERDDLVQAACVRLLEIRRRSEGNREFNASYLRRVAYCALIDETRRVRRRREDRLEQEMPESTIERSHDPETVAHSREIGSAIHDCLRQLVENRRLAATLYLQGHGVPEAAALLAWPRKKVENLVYRGLADLRRCLTGKGFAT